MSANETLLVSKHDVSHIVAGLDHVLSLPVPDEYILREVRRADFSARLNLLFNLDLINVDDYSSYRSRFSELYDMVV